MREERDGAIFLLTLYTLYVIDSVGGCIIQLILDLASKAALDHVGAIPHMESRIFYCNKRQLHIWFCLSILYYTIPLLNTHRPLDRPRTQPPDILHQNTQNPAIYRKEKQTREEQPRDKTGQPEKLQAEALVEPEDLYIVSCRVYVYSMVGR